ncbi:class I SAM-dependent methyltransferase [Lewinella sp. W8]|uniref:class I SAM-dependent methyltransferase n=1 Tax=Lewinella sp. W8 TaxID=2528208 RepID=UPI0010688DAB|nr:class I SAM-dependent methyltransferase [Lewinella sp. W8]MTB52917.1 methyltransferase domain-containing protein [Lewinella sp. W8]
MTKSDSSPTVFNELEKSKQFYRNLWGGDDLHVGIYRPAKLSPTEAGRKTTDKMLKLLPRLKRASKVLIIQSGFGTAARYIATKGKCKVECLNDDEVQNAFNEQQIAEEGLEKMVKVTLGDIDYMPYAPDTFDVVIAQDSFSITSKKRAMFRAIHRVVKPEGRLIFSALMRAENGCDASAEQLIEQLPVEELISEEDYQNDARRGFFQHVYSLDLSDNLPIHFEKLLGTLESERETFVEQISKKFVHQRVKAYQGFGELADRGCLKWGILMFQKMNA